jgi:hypothetical protein
MSFTEPTETTEPASTTAKAQSKGLSDIAPLDSKSGGLAPDIQLGVRRVTLTPQKLRTLPEIDVVGGRFQGPPTNRNISAGYVGQQLVNKSGAIERGQYDPASEAFSELSRLETADRTDLQNKLASIGLYGKNGRALSGTGFDSTDLSVMREFLNYANSKGLTVDAALPTLLSEVKPVVGIGRVIRTTAKQDIRSVLQKTTQEILGRSLSPNEIEKFVKTYERMEITEAMGGVRAPRLDVAAEQQVQQQFGPEAQAVGALGLFDILDRKIKGQA